MGRKSYRDAQHEEEWKGRHHETFPRLCTEGIRLHPHIYLRTPEVVLKKLDPSIIKKEKRGLFDQLDKQLLHSVGPIIKARLKPGMSKEQKINVIQQIADETHLAGITIVGIAYMMDYKNLPNNHFIPLSRRKRGYKEKREKLKKELIPILDSNLKTNMTQAEKAEFFMSLGKEKRVLSSILAEIAKSLGYKDIPMREINKKEAVQILKKDGIEVSEEEATYVLESLNAMRRGYGIDPKGSKPLTEKRKASLERRGYGKTGAVGPIREYQRKRITEVKDEFSNKMIEMFKEFKEKMPEDRAEIEVFNWLEKQKIPQVDRDMDRFITKAFFAKKEAVEK